MKRIAITGPESTGKSTLAQQLATHFNTVWVPEFARDYIADLNQPYTPEDLEKIAAGQLELQQAAEKQQPEILFTDTELLVIKVWSENAFGSCPAWILEKLESQTFDLYLLMDVDLPWEPDPQREHPHLRNYFFQLYKTQLEQYGFPYQIISGTEQQRFQAALRALQNV
ncbi:AAA family ATPase [Adhaeribacter soli]|uniref:ATP-binding protein n=1 Tax=Adhaeribacter soli TaxID=2607655 RepID=A0A5N1IX33_9BACT|nr:ATP-binding protein [Adhaeribacter soli]KAA9333706.1 ATP-binding protein [Adhaeribacter soli]